MTVWQPRERICSDPPPEALLEGIALFNGGEWYRCHEVLEELWAGEQGQARDLYQGILQVAVALHHWQEGNYPGALSLLRKSAMLLDHVAPVCQQVDVAALTESIDRLRAELERLGPPHMGKLDRQWIPAVRSISTRSDLQA